MRRTCSGWARLNKSSGGEEKFATLKSFPRKPCRIPGCAATSNSYPPAESRRPSPRVWRYTPTRSCLARPLVFCRTPESSAIWQPRSPKKNGLCPIGRNFTVWPHRRDMRSLFHREPVTGNARCWMNLRLGNRKLLPCRQLPDLRLFLAILKRARLLIAGDTGPLHFAAALGVPVIGLFAVGDSLLHTAPIYQKEQVIVGGSCVCDTKFLDSSICQDAHPCMESIQPYQVLQRLDRILGVAGKIGR